VFIGSGCATVRAASATAPAAPLGKTARPTVRQGSPRRVPWRKRASIAPTC
jgi:hypothetical protein